MKEEKEQYREMQNKCDKTIVKIYFGSTFFSLLYGIML